MSYIIRNLHFIVIHVPIAMLLFSFVFDVLAVVLRRKEWHVAGLLCLIVGTLGSIAAVLTGPEEERNSLFPQHELFGKISMIFFIVLTLARLWLQWKKQLEIGRNAVYLIAALIGVLLVSYTGHLGGEMVHPDRNQQIRKEGTTRERADRQRPSQTESQSPNQSSQQNSNGNNGSQ